MNNKKFITDEIQLQQDEGIFKSAYPVPTPILSYLQEVIKMQLRAIAFYLLRLRRQGMNNEKIKYDVIDTISCLIVGISYSEEQFNKIILRLSSDLKQAKDMYFSLCNKHDLKCDILKTFVKLPKELNHSSSIKLGQKILFEKNERLNLEQRTFMELIFNIIKSICVHVVELKELGIDDEDSYQVVLEMFDSVNSLIIAVEDLQDKIEKFATFDHGLLIQLHDIRQEKYGHIIPAEIEQTTRANKAILVSGTNLRELELLLEATKGKNIDVYTHGHMIMAHGFPKFKTYEHLVGNFGRGAETFMLDFAEFPGPIFLTKYSMQRIENLYRSRIFTADVIAPCGVFSLKDGDFSPLIESALNSKGFNHAVKKAQLKLNLDIQKMIEKINDLVNKIKTKQVKHIFLIGASNYTKIQEDYYTKFLSLMGDDCFVISFSYTNEKKNVLKVDSDYGFPFLYKIFDTFNEKISLETLSLNVLYTRCEVHTISNVIYMKKQIGIKNIYFADCPSSMINPAIINSMREIFGLKLYTTPEADFKAMTEAE